MAIKKFLNKNVAGVKQNASTVKTKMGKVATRANCAHVLMLFFVSFNTIGAWIFAPQYGFITAGICSGIYGYLLGNE